jgi:putative nucleotidyltransferase with HDIG domain
VVSLFRLLASADSGPLAEAEAEDALTRDANALTPRERIAEAVVGGAFCVVALAFAVGLPADHSLNLVGAVGAVIALALASRVRFTVGGHYTVPVMLVFVPFLYAVPLPLLPLFTAIAFAVGGLPDVLRGRSAPARLLLAPANAWFSIGPVAVLALAGEPSLGNTHPLLLLGMLLSQFAADFVASAVRERIIGGPTIREQAAEVVWVCAVDAGFAPVGLLTAYAVEERPWAIMLLIPLLGLLRLFASERRARLESLVELNHAYRGTALVLGDVVEADDSYTGEHCRGVVEMALRVADSLRLDAAARQRTEFGALLHDVGKIAIPKEIINKPGPLDDREWEIVKTHTVEGHQMLERVGGLMRDVGVIVRAHHERWDGGGYPDGLAGDDIPIEARVVSACDTYNAMTTNRPYRAAMSEVDALAELEACAGGQLDPIVVAHLTQIVAADAEGRAALACTQAAAAVPSVTPPGGALAA